MTRSRAIAAAIVWRAEVRAALEHLAWNFDLRLAAVVAFVFSAAARVVWNTTRFRRVSFVRGGPPVGGPFPHVTDHVVEAVTVRRKRRDRGRPLVAVGGKILMRKGALPGVSHLAPARSEFFAPGEFGTVQSA